MVKTKILISVIIVIVIGVAAAGYQVSNTPGLWTPTTTQEQPSVSQNNPSVQTQSGSTVDTGSGSSQSSSSNGGSSVKISPSQAKSIAQKSIAEQGATTGTPKIITIKGKKTYVVPVITNGKTSGEIWIDAQTGENVGGAGGAPNG